MNYTKRKKESHTYLSNFYISNNLSNLIAFHQEPFLPLKVANAVPSLCSKSLETHFDHCV